MCVGIVQSSNVSVSLNVCGVLTLVQLASLNSAPKAPEGSALMNFQSGLKFNVWRSAPETDCAIKNANPRRTGTSLFTRMGSRAFLEFIGFNATVSSQEVRLIRH